MRRTPIRLVDAGWDRELTAAIRADPSAVRVGPFIKKGAFENQGDKVDELLAEKHRSLAARSSNPLDNLKPASGEIYNVCENVLRLTQCGNDARTFMPDTLAPLIRPGMAVYEELKLAIFGTPTRTRNHGEGYDPHETPGLIAR